VKALILVPAFNEATVIYSVLNSIPKKINHLENVEIIVVDDGSHDNTKKEAKRAGIQVISHILNRGLGAAIKTGIQYAREKKYDILVTFDGDGQHDPLDIQKIVQPILMQKADVVIGSRFITKEGVPFDRLIINSLANVATYLLFGTKSTDSQSGLRALSKKAIALIDFKADRMEFSSEILLEAKKHNLIVKEIPIKAIYTEYSRAKGQKNTNAFPVMFKFLVKLFR